MALIGRRALIASSLAAGLSVPARAGSGTPPSRADEPEHAHRLGESIDLWPMNLSNAPRQTPMETIVERPTDGINADRAISGISRPRLLVLQPERSNGAAILLAPGGGYRRLIVDKEGHGMAHWLAKQGFTTFVLLYRLPGEGWANRADVPLADAQRAMRLIRYRSKDYAIDPGRVSVMGFSAGGHVCASLSTRFATCVYKPGDTADQLSARPHSAALIYPVVSMERNIAHPSSRRLLLGTTPTIAQEALYSPNRQVPADAPPHFLLHAEDDTVVSVENTLLLRAGLKARGIPVETHLFADGGHGFGIHKGAGKPVEAWPQLWRAWARAVALG